jgi:RimJ/RimL family protein N-acetyltransferase
MAYYHEKLKEIKNLGCVDFMKIKHGGKYAILKLVDESDETVNLLCSWRKKYRNMFATDFKISEEKTRKWIKTGVLENPEKIVFMIYVDNKKIGIISSAKYDKKTNSAILDTMMKDPTYNFPGLMTIIEKVYLRWMFDGLKLSKITGFLFSDNKRMMNIHKKCGWVIIKVVPVERKKTKDGTKWEEIESKSNDKHVERYFNIIELSRENLVKNFGDIEFEIFA